MKWLSHKCTCIVDFFHIFWNSLSVHFFNSLKKLLKGWNDIVSYFIRWNSLSPEILILRKYGLKVEFIILYCHFFHRPFQETLIIMRRRLTSLKRSFRHNTSSSNLWPSVGGSPLDWMYWSVSMVGNFQHILSSHCVHYKPIFSLLKHQSKLRGIKSKYKRIKYIWCTEAQHHLNIHVLTYNSWCVFRSR